MACGVHGEWHVQEEHDTDNGLKGAKVYFEGMTLVVVGILSGLVSVVRRVRG